MPRIVFAFGGNPELSAMEALDLADLLVRRRDYAAFSLGTRIRTAIDPLAPDEGISTLITLTNEQKEQIAQALDDTPLLLSSGRFAALRAEITAALEQPDPAHGLRMARTAPPAQGGGTVAADDGSESRGAEQRRAS
jgi:hypothetical protein